jgi:glycosyltransferase involved in cell wall biosynthesis
MRPFRLCKLLAEKGHDVVVITTDFNFASGESEGPAYESIETSGKPIIIHRIASNRDFRKSLFHRVKTYAGFAVKALWKGFWVSNRSQIVVTSIQPIFIGPIGWLIAVFRRAPFFLEVRDIWPDALEVKGAVTNKTVLALLYGLANFLYRRACHIVSITPGIAEELVKKGIPADKIDVLPNGMDPDLFPDVNIERQATRRRLGWEDQFIAIYIGVHTEVTSMDTIVAAAERLKYYKHIRFEVFGSGSTTPQLEQRIVQNQISNCRLNGTVNKAEVPQILAAADACLMCLFESPLIHIYFQNKFFDYMGAGKPIAAALRGHQRSIMEQHQIGLCVDPFDSDGLADAVLHLASNPTLCRKMGKNGRSFANAHYRLDKLLKKYAELLIHHARRQPAFEGTKNPVIG